MWREARANKKNDERFFIFIFFLIEGIGKAQGMWEFRGLEETGVFSVLVCGGGGGGTGGHSFTLHQERFMLDSRKQTSKLLVKIGGTFMGHLDLP